MFRSSQLRHLSRSPRDTLFGSVHTALSLWYNFGPAWGDSVSSIIAPRPLRAGAPTTLNMRQFLLDRSNIAQTAVVTLATIAALAMLGLVAAYWTWVWLAPLPEPRALTAADTGTAAASAGALFGSMRRERNSPVPTGIAIRLLGVVAATGGRRGYAVVQLEAKEILAVREGEDVAPGVRLAEVGTDHVILERGGIRETLAWPEKNTATESAALRANR